MDLPENLSPCYGDSFFYLSTNCFGGIFHIKLLFSFEDNALITPF